MTKTPGKPYPSADTTRETFRDTNMTRTDKARFATVDSSFALLGARQHCVAKKCNASQTANAQKLQNDRTLNSLAPRNTRCHIRAIPVIDGILIQIQHERGHDVAVYDTSDVLFVKLLVRSAKRRL